jgi:hypothetical protein
MTPRTIIELLGLVDCSGELNDKACRLEEMNA